MDSFEINDFKTSIRFYKDTSGYSFVEITPKSASIQTYGFSKGKAVFLSGEIKDPSGAPKKMISVSHEKLEDVKKITALTSTIVTNGTSSITIALKEIKVKKPSNTVTHIRLNIGVNDDRIQCKTKSSKYKPWLYAEPNGPLQLLT